LLNRLFAILIVATVLVAAAHPLAVAQHMILAAQPDGLPSVDAGAALSIVPPPTFPRMAPELALQVYEHRRTAQLSELQASTDLTIMRAELPDTEQQGVFELQRHYAAPRSLSFSPQKFEGDKFVKTNILVRLLQSEVDHIEKQLGPRTAISEENYKFSYKGSDQLDEQPVHVFQVKPRKKRPGLFKGRIYLNALTGSLRRVEGTLVKSPSIWIKKVEFVQDYADVGVFTFPLRLHSVCKIRMLGRAIVDILHRDYKATSAALQAVSQDQPAVAPAQAAN
jgi:hypothetical protein